LVQEVVSPRPDLASRVVILDFDLEDDENATVTYPDGWKRRGTVLGHDVTSAVMHISEDNGAAAGELRA